MITKQKAKHPTKQDSSLGAYGRFVVKDYLPLPLCFHGFVSTIVATTNNTALTANNTTDFWTSGLMGSSLTPLGPVRNLS
ncbi:MAG: hypothetical protein Greene101447_483 [Parcubacteria group bacterium Greene1014_47]|nr:MAG: hypothetical protein Greene101447_483 [Parcubacteria group bacterium Greene1014_47]